MIVLVLFSVIVVGAVLLVTYLAGSLGTLTQQRQAAVYTVQPTTPPPLPGTPIAPFEQVNPAIVDESSAFQSGYRSAVPDPFDVSPIGAYLPRSGNRQFALQDPTPYPTLFPYPTSPPLQIPPVAGAPTPTPGARRQVITDCAPAGRPAAGGLTQRFHRYHLAIDIGVSIGTPVRATHSGQVVFADWNSIGYGYLVILQSGGFITYYAHNSSLVVEAGDMVSKGDLLAYSGSTGNSSGPHIHYETRINDIPVDPLTFANRGYGTC
jgi:murein DD-endopeptidase MepM/ murein hydrolase activator NlpD